MVFSILGTTVDRAVTSNRWDKWRPTVSLFQHEDLIIDRLELIHDGRNVELVKTLTDDIRQVSPETTIQLQEITWNDPWDFEEVYGSLMDFCQGYTFNNDEEQYLVHLTTGTHVAQICWFLLTESRHLPGQLIQSSPPGKKRMSGGKYSIIDLDLSRYDSIAARFLQETEKGLAFLKGGIQTRNSAFNAMIGEIEQVAINSKSPILVMGPTGSGKTQLARRIYALKKNRKQVSGEFVAINCGTLRGDAAMASLFGHTKGAFTGANVERKGLLKSADGGMVFLDEIGELGLDEQAMLLHAIEEKRYRPLGADREIESDFQIIAGTNRDLNKAVIAGEFRADLLARINLWTYRLPGLAERPEDIEPNLQFECIRFEETHGRKVRFNKEAWNEYLNFATSRRAAWSGNFRDLSSSLTRMATLAGSHRINAPIVQQEIEKLTSQWDNSIGLTESDNHDDPLTGIISREQLSEMDLFDQIQLRETIRICRKCKNLSEAGRKLFQVSRTRKSSQNDASRLGKFLKGFNLDWNSINRD